MKKTEEYVEELNLKSLFLRKKYVVPIYQRSYAWEKYEIEQLIEDIIESEGDYYLGNLIVDRIDENVFSVIDGQQRLTTLFLILCHVSSDLLLNDSLSFESRLKSNKTLKRIKENKDFSETDDIYSDEIISGNKIIKEYFNTYKDCIKKIQERLSQIIILKTQVPKNIDLNHYFEIMNTRGEQLELHEIAKGRILAKINDYNSRKIAGQIWDSCSQMDSYIQMNFSKEIRNELFGKNWGDFNCKSFEEVKEKFSERSEGTKSYSIKEILSKMNSSDEEEIEPNKTPTEENQRFESVVSFPNFLLIVAESLTKSFDEDDDDSLLDDKKFIKNMESYWETEDKALDFIFNLLKFRFLFDKYILKREYYKSYQEDGQWSLKKLYKYFDKKKNSDKPQYKGTFSDSDSDNDVDENGKNQQLKLLQSALRVTYTSPKTMHWISFVLHKLNQNEDVDLIKYLEKYSCEKIRKSDFKNKKGFGIERITFTYLDYLLIRDKKVTIKNFSFQFRNSIEHFYPQNPIDSEKWDEDVLNCFGNLALLTVKANSKYSNLPPESKITYSKETSNQSPKLKKMEDLTRENNNWTKDLAIEHGKEMIKILEEEITGALL